MLNHIVIQGRLVRDPELRQTQNGTAVATFTLAVDRDFAKDQADFFSCTAWRNTAEFVSKYFRKGQLAVVSGKMQSRNWTDKDNNKRTAWEIQAENVYFGESKRDTPELHQVSPELHPVLDDEEDIPF